MEQLILQFLITAIQQRKRALTICTENPVIQESIQKEQFTVETFSGKRLYLTRY